MKSNTEPTGFTAEERELIGRDPAARMRLWTVDDLRDSLLLRTPSSELPVEEIGSDSFNTLIDRMSATVLDPDNLGVGIAAPQVGLLRRIVLVQRFDREGEPFEVCVNPSIVEYGADSCVGEEGCLSVPGRSGSVMRADRIVISYTDLETRRTVEEAVTGLTSVIFQHEIDHLDGILFTDRQQQNRVRTITYTPANGVCAKAIHVVIENDRVAAIRVEGGCSGNSQGVAALIEGMPVDEAVRRLEGIRCGGKDTSCPDQIAKALRSISDSE